ncbi:MAG: murein L,D-transpeptidase catalytic domain family protein [Bacteroidia bacterium]|nr:murein L,D-transpeptidase catalytic domain family protein [Bacteroidia bacterium]
MKPLLIGFCVFLSVLQSCTSGNNNTNEQKPEEEASSTQSNEHRIKKERLHEAREFCLENSYNTSVAFLSDMSMRSGRKRFFIVDLERDSLIGKGLVTHGHCQNYAARKPSFSNEVGSNCTSLGKYKVGYKYEGRFGTAYKLHGLETTNSNAFERFVVLHAHDCVPQSEAMFGICRSEGCPTVSPDFLSELETIIDRSEKPVLLWIYN